MNSMYLLFRIKDFKSFIQLLMVFFFSLNINLN